MTALTYLPGLSGTLLSASLALLLLLRKPGRTWLLNVALTVLIGIWCFSQLLWITASDTESAIRAAQLQYIAISLVPFVWLQIARVETGKSASWKFITTALVIVPATTIFLALAYSAENPNALWNNIYLDNSREVPRVEYGSWFWIHAAYCYTTILTGCLFFYGHFFQSPYYQQHLFFSCAIPIALICLNFIYITGNWPFSMDPTPLGFALALVPWTWRVFKGDMFSLSPIARTLAVEKISECLIIVDQKGRVADYNEAAKALFGNKETIIGEPLIELIDDLPPITPKTETTVIQPAVNTYMELRVSPVDMSPLARTFTGRGADMIVTLRDVSRQHQTHEMLLKSRQELEEANLKLSSLANTDELTGLANRRFLLSRLDEEISRARRLDQPLGVLFIDLDRFKAINDSFGHAIGDEVLKAVGSQLLDHRKGIDIAARYGGEELIMVVTNTHREGIFQAAERLWKSIGNMSIETHTGGHLKVTASIGIAMLEATDISGYDLISRADRALYHAKNAGRNQVSLFEHQIYTTLYQTGD